MYRGFVCYSGRSVRTRREKILWGFLCVVLGQTNSDKTFTLCVYCTREREREIAGEKRIETEMRIKFRGSINNKCVINIHRTLYYIPKTAKSCYIMYGYKYINKCIRPTSWHFLCDRFQEVLGSHVDDPFVLHWSKLQKPHLPVRGWRLFLLWILLKLISKVLWQSLSGVITLFFICLAHAHVAVLQCTLIRWAGQIFVRE